MRRKTLKRNALNLTKISLIIEAEAMTAEEKIGHVLGISGFLGRLPGPDVTRFARFQVVPRAKSIIGYGVKLLNETRAWYYTDPGPVPIMTLTTNESYYVSKIQ